MEVQCPTCSRSYSNDTEQFCADCGTRLPVDSPVAIAGGAAVQPALSPVEALQTIGVPASRGTRIAAFSIDLAILVVIGMFDFVPLLGQYLFALISAVFVLLRDANGASFGKSMLGCVVVSKDGNPATMKQKMLRNVIFLLPELAALIPFLGIFLGPIGFGTVACLELFVLLVTGERIGDQMAGTMVVKRS